MTAKPPRLAAPGVLLTDLYQLTMLQGYFERGMTETAVFEFFARELPACRHFYLAAGLEQALDYLEQLRFSPAELAWLATQRIFKPAFLDYLAALRFTGDVHAMPEGTPFFADEPILRVTAPLPEAQLVESRLINLLHFQTLVASKAARIVLQAPGKRLVDFGLRRSHGAEAGLFAARASYLAGFSATATVLAGAQFGIPLAGTMAHSFVQAHADEREAFAHFAESLPQSVVLLIDTYDTEAGAARVVELAPQLAARGLAVHGVRLDSGDLGAHARRVRAILDAGGLGRVTLFASGSVDEYLIRGPAGPGGADRRLWRRYAAGYVQRCAGARLRLQIAGIRRTAAPQALRRQGNLAWTQAGLSTLRRGRLLPGDTLALEAEVAAGAPLLEQVMHQGQRLRPSPGLDEVRRYTRAQLASLPPALRGLDPAPPYAVRISASIRALAAEADRFSAGL
ncbi:nicotinate phosphoribosyltransferase [Stutzerimonas balearica]|uniref:nicotinate phosphoribosyltransferase n=1 Tax=Stutzerimonas balearica TaxID=74829 RepID=UPI000A61B3D8|nr:nicotinate phosphoribosyltransferase [Stutzerimonas balearica]